MSATPPSVSEIRATQEQLGALVRRTPVWEWRTGEVQRRLGTDTRAFLKLELFQYTGTFKARGALSNMLSLGKDELARGVTAVSAGNHAMAVGYAAEVLGTTGKVVMPRNANPARVNACRTLGAEVVLAENVHEAFEEVKRIERTEGRTFIHPFDGALTARGTATLGLELAEQAPDLDAVIIPIGGGGLCAGVAAAMKQLQPDCVVYGVEPDGADTMHRSFAAGEPRSIEAVRTIADSLGAPHAAQYSFEVCHQCVDELVRVSDDDLCHAMAILFEELKLAVEPACAASTAALLGPLGNRLAGKRVALILCGSNIDIEGFTEHTKRGRANFSHG